MRGEQVFIGRRLALFNRVTFKCLFIVPTLHAIRGVPTTPGTEKKLSELQRIQMAILKRIKAFLYN